MVLLKFLVVDDNESDLLLFVEAIESITEYLRTKDIIVEFTITQAYDGIDCLNKVDDTYDMIFMDIAMPKLNGIECLYRLKNEKKVKSKVIMFTTSDYDDDIKKSNKNGANGYIVKSLDVIEFEENLKTIIVLFIQDNFVYVNFIGDRYNSLLKNN